MQLKQRDEGRLAKAGVLNLSLASRRAQSWGAEVLPREV